MTAPTRSVVGWKMVGGHYRHGWRSPGFTLLLLDDGSTKYYPESVGIGDALDRANREHGIDVFDARARLTEWVKTGKGATFSLEKS